MRFPRSISRGVLFALVLAAAPALSTPSPVAAQTADELRERIEGPQDDPGPGGLGELTLTELMDSLGVPGVSLAVIRDFRVEWERGYGTADVETGAPVTPATLFQAASISKPVAAMATLRAVQDGLFALDDDIDDILTSWSFDGGALTERRAVTPEGLLSHTAGMGDAFGFPGYDPVDDPIPTVVEILEGGERSNVGPLWIEREPGTAYEYSGGGVTLMQLALSDARGRPFADILRDDVLAPIGMANSTFEQPLPAERVGDAARAHSGQGASKGAPFHVYPEQQAAGLWTTAGDLARFAVEVQRSVRGESNRVLDVAHARRMITPVGVGPFAIGFTIAKRGEGWYFSHGGSNWGFRANLVAHVSRGYGFAIMTNSDSGGRLMAEVQRRIERALEFDSLDEPTPRRYAPEITRPDVDLPEEVLAGLVGRWRSEGGELLEIALTAGILSAAPGGGAQRYTMSPLSETEFALRGPGVVMTFSSSTGGAPDRLELLVAGRTTVYERVEGGR